MFLSTFMVVTEPSNPVASVSSYEIILKPFSVRQLALVTSSVSDFSLSCHCLLTSDIKTSFLFKICSLILYAGNCSFKLFAAQCRGVFHKENLSAVYDIFRCALSLTVSKKIVLKKVKFSCFCSFGSRRNNSYTVVSRFKNKLPNKLAVGASQYYSIRT